MLDFSKLPEDVVATIPQDLSNDPSLANFNTIGDLVKGHVELSKKPVEWTSGLDEGQKTLLTAKGWKTPADILKSYSDIEKYMGHDKIAMPRKGADGKYEPGELERVLNTLGVPTDAKNYKTSAEFKLPDGVSLDATQLEAFKVGAQKQGFLPHQFSFVMDQLSAMLTKGAKDREEANNKSFNEASLGLRSKWGVAYDDKMKLANRVLNTFGDKTKGSEIVSKYGNDPYIVEILANIGESLSEEGLSKVGISGDLLTPDAAQMEINKIKADPKHAYFNASHPEHKFWVDKMEELYRMTGK